MSEITREQFAAAVVASVSSVQHLYRALDRLMVELREALADPPTALVPIPFTTGKSSKDAGRLVLRYEYGTLFRPAAAADEPEEEDDDDEELDDSEESDDDDSESPKRKRGSPQIDADEALMAVRIVMYEARQQAGFEPHVAFAVMRDWRIGERAADPSYPLMFMRHMLRRIPKALAYADRKKGASLVTAATVKRLPGVKKGKGDGRRLACRLPMGIEVVPLFELEDPAAVNGLAERMKAMWAAAAEQARKG